MLDDMVQAFGKHCRLMAPWVPGLVCTQHNQVQNRVKHEGC